MQSGSFARNVHFFCIVEITLMQASSLLTRLYKCETQSQLMSYQ